MFCTKCGAQLKETQKFCVKCGAKAPVKTAPQPPAPQPKPTAPPASSTPETMRPPAAPTQPTAPHPPAEEQRAPAQPSITESPASTYTPAPTPSKSSATPPASSTQQTSTPTTDATMPETSRVSAKASHRPTRPAATERILHGATTTEKRNLLWLWIGAAVIVLCAGGYFGYRHWHGPSIAKQTSVQQNNAPVKPSTTSSTSSTSANTRQNSNGNVKPNGPAKTVSSSKGTENTSKVVSASKGTSKGAVLSNIHNVDFRDFVYHSDVLHKTIRVTNGKWQGPTVQDTPGDLFGISKVTYGYPKRNRKEEAVVWAGAQFGGMSPNTGQSELFVYSMANGRPHLLAHLTEKDWVEGSESEGGIITGLQVLPGQILIKFFARSDYKSWNDTAVMRWKNGRLVRTRLVRPPNAGQVAQATGQEPLRQTGETPTRAKTKTTKQNGCGSWGFQTAGCGPGKVVHPLVKPGPVVPPSPGTSPKIVRPTNPVPPTKPVVSPLPAPPKPVASSGTLVWSGHFDKDGLITIQGHSASSGTLEGQLPGVPVMIQVYPSNIAVAEFPGPQNGWKKMVLRGSKSQNVVVRIQWKTLQQ